VKSVLTGWVTLVARPGDPEAAKLVAIELP
jgi:hypothetical protein